MIIFKRKNKVCTILHLTGRGTPKVCKSPKLLIRRQTENPTSNKPGEQKKEFDMQPSLASLGDGLLSRADSQRDEAKMQDPGLVRT